MALFFSNVRPDSCKEILLSFSRATLGKASHLPGESLRLCVCSVQAVPGKSVREAGARKACSECAHGCRARTQRAVCQLGLSGCSDCPRGLDTFDWFCLKERRQGRPGENRQGPLTEGFADCGACRSGLSVEGCLKGCKEEQTGRTAGEGRGRKAWRKGDGCGKSLGDSGEDQSGRVRESLRL